MEVLRNKVGRIALSLGVVALGIGLAGGTATGADDRKLDRQIDLFERIMDDMLVESPNWLVQSSRETRGRYKSGTGVRFSFDVSLVNSGWHGGHGSHKWWKMWKDDDDVIVIDVDDFDDMDEEEIQALLKSEKKSRARSTARAVEKQERRYDRGKTEVLQVILDFGDVFTGLPATDTIQIVAYLENAELFDNKDVETLTVTAKMSDVRAFADGSIDEKTMISRITVEES